MRIAVAGLGWWGKQIIACLEKSSRFEIAMGVDPSPPADVEEFRRSHPFKHSRSLDDALSDPTVEGIVLATPHALHEQQALQAIAAGKNLFCEKPLAMTGEGAKRIVAACRRAGRVLGVGHERRFEPAFEEVQRLVSEGALGKILLLDANVSHDNFRKLARDNWRLSPESAPAGMMTAVGIHVTDIFIKLAGPAREVRGSSARFIFQPPAEDYMSAEIRFKSGVVGAFRSLSITPFYARFTVYGDAGWVEVVNEANVDQGKPTVLTHGGHAGRRSVVYEATDTVTQNFEAWADAVDGKTSYRFTDAELVENIRVFEAIVTSARHNGAPQSLG
jgi:predicted dehydrogenase